METLENLKNDYAKEQGYEEWEHLTNDMQPHSNMYLEQAMNEICIRAQKAALENEMVKIIGWFRTNGEMSEDGKYITYSCEEIEDVFTKFLT